MNGFIILKSAIVVRTVGFSRPLSFRFGNYDVNVFDLGGCATFRSVLNDYFFEV